jgi:lysophospholipase L1-like esterase
VRAASTLLQRLQASAVEAAGGVVAADAVAVSEAFAGDPAMFSADRFHPSSAGYAHIAAALTPHVLRAARARRDTAA